MATASYIACVLWRLPNRSADQQRSAASSVRLMTRACVRRVRHDGGSVHGYCQVACTSACTAGAGRCHSVQFFNMVRLIGITLLRMEDTACVLWLHTRLHACAEHKRLSCVSRQRLKRRWMMMVDGGLILWAPGAGGGGGVRGQVGDQARGTKRQPTQKRGRVEIIHVLDSVLGSLWSLYDGAAWHCLPESSAGT